MRSKWCEEETESSGCLWGYSMINAPHEQQKTAMSTLSLLTGFQKDIWIFSMGFFGFWGSKCETPVGEKTLKLISDFLEGSSIGDGDDSEYSDIVLCLTVLYLWVKKLPKSESSERTLDTLLVQLSTISYKSRGSIQLFWSDALVPILGSKLELKSYSKKVKLLSNSSSTPLRGLLDWVGENPSLVKGLGDAMSDLLCESEGALDAIEGEENGEIRAETAEENTEMDVEIEGEKSVNEKSKKRKLSIDNTGADVGVRHGKNQVEEQKEGGSDDEDDVDLGSFELDYSGSTNSNSSTNAESVFVRDTVKDSKGVGKGNSKGESAGGGKEETRGVLTYMTGGAEVWTKKKYTTLL